jgi:outer membrane protein TolC
MTSWCAACRPIRPALFALVSLGVSAAALAQTAGPAEPLTLAQAIEQALAGQPGLAAARADARAATADASASRAGWWPRISLTESWQRSTQPVFGFSTLLSSRRFTAADFAVDRLNDPGPVAGFTSRIGFAQTLFDGGRTGGAARAADARATLADAAVSEAAHGLVVDVTRAYTQAVALEAAARAARAALEAAEADRARAARRRDAGTATDADVLAFVVHHADMRQRLAQVDGDLAAARAELNRLRGAPIDRLVVVEPPAPDPAAADVAALTARALETRPEVRQADAAVDAAVARDRATRAFWQPEVVAHAGYDWTGLSIADRAGAWMVGAELRWSISASGADRARARAAAAAVDAAEARRDEIRARVAVDVLAAARRLDAARLKSTVGVEAVAQAAEGLRIVRNRYEAGLASVTDLLRATSAHLDAESRRDAAAADVIVAEAELRRAAGDLSGVPVR